MSCDRRVACPSCEAYNDGNCLDTEGDHDISQADVDRYLATAAKREHQGNLEFIITYVDVLQRYFDVKPIFDPLEG